MYVLYSTLLHLPPLRFHCVGGCWDETLQRTVATSALAVRRSNHSARSHPCLGFISSTIIKTNISRTIFRWGNVVNNRAMFRSSGKDCLGPVCLDVVGPKKKMIGCLLVFNSLWESGIKNSQKPLSAVPLLLMPPLYNDL